MSPVDLPIFSLRQFWGCRPKHDSIWQLDGELYAPTSRLDSATLLRRTFDVDVRDCLRCGGRLKGFFFRLGGPANLIDKLKDGREDHARGEIALAPGVVLYARLALAMLFRLPALFASHPRWSRVVGLGFRYLRPGSVLSR